MQIRPKHTLALLAAAAMVVLPSFAHEGDGKARDRQKPVYGPVYRESEGGVAGGTFAASGVALKSWFPLNTLDVASTSGNSCWGYISPAGREYAIIGISSGTAWVEVTDPANAQLRAFRTGPTSLWRDMRVFGNICYCASEGGSGVQIFDMSQLDATGTVSVLGTINTPTGTNAATHTLAIDTVSGTLFRAGGGSNGLRMYDVNTTPGNPPYVGAWSSVYVHEMTPKTYTTGVYAGKQIAFCCGGGNGGNVNTGLYIVDVTNKAAPVQLGFVTYPGARYCHQGWLSADLKYFYINDELDEGNTTTTTDTIVIDVQTLATPTYVGKFTNGNVAIGHNLFTVGNLLLEANYRSGMRVFDLGASVTNPPEVAYFDTYPSSDAPNFNGLWNVWPYFPSGTIIGSDLERGLFVWRLQVDAANFELVGTAPTFVSPVGTSTIDMRVLASSGHTINPSTVKMNITGSNGANVAVPMSSLGSNIYRAIFPSDACTTLASYTFTASNNVGDTSTDPTSRSTTYALGSTEVLLDTFETNLGWTGGITGDTATSGQWVRADPVGTTAQPEDDHTAVGTLCWITGNGAVGGTVGVADVDGGTTTLLSPALNLAGFSEPMISYHRWYSNNQGASAGLDTMPVEISGNNGVTWVQMELVAENAGAWVRKAFRVRDYITPTTQVRVRFIARDLDSGSVIEAGVDDFHVYNLQCPAILLGDLNGDGVVNAADLTIMLNAWGSSNAAADINGNGVVGAEDISMLLNGWTG
ncbi:MAG: choice-of-anchor B family protein [Phycisphaerales bacterium]|nr:choice-of-anchor B family protein [Phycisphaerales bacterium]